MPNGGDLTVDPKATRPANAGSVSTESLRAHLNELADKCDPFGLERIIRVRSLIGYVPSQLFDGAGADEGDGVYVFQMAERMIVRRAEPAVGAVVVAYPG